MAPAFFFLAKGLYCLTATCTCNFFRIWILPYLPGLSVTQMPSFYFIPNERGWLIDWYFYWKAYLQESHHVGSKGDPKTTTRKSNIRIPQGRRQRVPEKGTSQEGKDCTTTMTELIFNTGIWVYQQSLLQSLTAPFFWLLVQCLTFSPCGRCFPVTISANLEQTS